MIPWPKLQEMTEDFVAMGVRAVQVTGGGEPTVHPHFDQFCSEILEKKIGLAVVTNGLLLKQKRAELLAQADWVRISIDCGNAVSYGKIRDVPYDEYNIVAENVRRLASIPNRKTVLGLGFVVTKDNYTELYEGCRQFKEWGADNVRISAVFQNDGHNYFAGIHEAILEQIQQCLTLGDDKFKVFNNFDLRYGDLEQGTPDYSFCPYMHMTTYIGGDQNVYTCCVNAYNNRGMVGSIKDRRFKDLWDGQGKREFFGGFDAKNCERCMFNEKNRFINSLLREPTVHDNFV
jgi:MoaA/NifB/PqqE/SkfB family radical SAM enzyme